jgi:purine nucleosidase
MPNIDLSAVWITPADCLAFPTADACGRMQTLIGAAGVPLYLSDSSSERPFPWEYRQYAMMVNLLPILNPTPPFAAPPLNQVSFGSVNAPAQAAAFADLVKAAADGAGSAATMLVTCPCTDLARLMTLAPSIADSIGEIVWMGGTINAGGNIDTGIAPGANPNAEWNAYWDPASVLTVLESGLRFTMFPLDITNLTALSPATLQQYFLPKASSNELINLICQMYALVAFQGGYSFWDTLTAAYLGNPGLFTFQSESVNIDINPQSPTFGQFIGTGHTVNMCSGFAAGTTQGPQLFYQYLVSQLMSITT